MSPNKKELLRLVFEQAKGIYRKKSYLRDQFQVLLQEMDYWENRRVSRRGKHNLLAAAQAGDLALYLISFPEDGQWNEALEKLIDILAKEWGTQGYINYGKAKKTLMARISNELAMVALE